MSGKRLKIGIVGVCRGSSLANVFEGHPETEIIAACDLNPAVLKSFAEKHSGARTFIEYKKMLKQDLDIVVISTPPYLHAEQSILALKEGKHVLSEVPAAVSLKECEKLTKAVEDTKRKYMMAENCNYFPVVKTIKKLVRDRRLGDIFYMESEYLHNIGELKTDKNGNPTWRAAYHPFLYLTHSTGPIISILDEELIEVTAMQSRIATDINKRFGVPDAVVGLFRTKRNIIIKITNSFSMYRPYQLTYSIYGSKGTYESARAKWDKDKAFFEDISNQNDMIPMETAFSSEYGLPLKHLPALAASGGHGTSEFFMIDDFVQSITKNTKPPIDIYTAVNYTIPGICAFESITKNRAVKIPNF